MKRSEFLKNKPRPTPNSNVLTGRYISKYKEIPLLPQWIEVYDVYLNEGSGQVMIKYKTDRDEDIESRLDYLTNFCRTEKERRHAKYF